MKNSLNISGFLSAKDVQTLQYTSYLNFTSSLATSKHTVKFGSQLLVLSFSENILPVSKNSLNIKRKLLPLTLTTKEHNLKQNTNFSLIVFQIYFFFL